MRITNKIMQKNNLSNINTNKIYQDKLSTQMSTQKKVSRPSDDPVVAIRALRLRTSVNEVTQAYSRNIPDAESWIEVTEGALKNLTDIVTSMYDQCTKGSNGKLEAKDRMVILEQLKALRDEVYSTGDEDYAGRYVFTGFRTDTSLSFPDDTKKHYEITEQLDNSALDKVTHVVTRRTTGTPPAQQTTDLLDWNETNFATGDMSGFTEQDIDVSECYRIRLAYDDCQEGALPQLSVWDKNATPPGYGPWAGNAAMQQVHSYEDPYTVAAQDPDAVIYVPETGEILLGTNRYNDLAAIRDDPTTAADEGEIRVTYEKSEWVDGDLRPEHYFYCKDVEENIEYNADYLTGDPEKQVIEYDVGFNQSIRINSTADECFKHGIGREVDDLMAAMQETLDIEAVKNKIEKAMETETDETKKATLKNQLDAVNKAWTLSKNKCQRLYENGITEMQGYLDQANLAITNNGTRGRKLELIENRMQNQKTTFETLKSENEDVDITEVAIYLNSAKLTYEAALMATGKVVQTTLLSFI